MRERETQTVLYESDLVSLVFKNIFTVTSICTRRDDEITQGGICFILVVLVFPW